MLVRHTSLMLLVWRHSWIGVVYDPGHRLLIERFDVLGPGVQLLILGKIIFQVMDITQEVDPAALMQTLMDVVPRVEITAQHALEVLPDQLLDHFSTARMVVFVIADA